MDLDGYCYNSVEALEKCTNEIAKGMEPYYDDAGKRVWENVGIHLEQIATVALA